MDIRVKRIFDEADENDGIRILVDRLWPRGVSKHGAGLDIWVRDVAPSAQLRKWFDHDPNKWNEFQRRYFSELRDNDEAVFLLREQVSKGIVTLLFSAKDVTYNNAIALRAYLLQSA